MFAAHPPEIRERVIALRQQGEPTKTIADSLGVSLPFVKRVLRKAGLATVLRDARDARIEQEARQVNRLLKKGLTHKEIAKKLKIPDHTVEHRAAHARTHLDSRHEYLTEVAKQCGVSRSTLYDSARRGLFTFAYHGVRAVVDHQTATMLRAKYAAQLNAHEAKDWFTAAEAGRAFNLTAAAFLQRREKDARLGSIRRARIRSKAGVPYRYHPGDVREVSRTYPRTFPGRPRDRLSTKQLAAVAGVVSSAISTWVKRGCPHLRASYGHTWFKVSEVLAWLEGPGALRKANDRQRTERDALISRLRAHLEQQKRAA